MELYAARAPFPYLPTPRHLEEGGVETKRGRQNRAPIVGAKIGSQKWEPKVGAKVGAKSVRQTSAPKELAKEPRVSAKSGSGAEEAKTTHADDDVYPDTCLKSNRKDPGRSRNGL